MSVNSVLTGLLPSSSLLSGTSNPSQSAKSAALAQELQEKAFGKTDVSQVTSAEVDSAAQESSGRSSDPGDLFQSTLEQELRKGRATAGSSTNAASGSPDGRSSPGIALYQRISQYGNNEASTSALLKSWNNIMRGGQAADTATAAFVKTLSQSETPGFESRVLDLTA